MKLKRVKLAGFKSFVDATVVSLQSNLTGIVGPNGCGKSNIIDAIRWVMGESSAKQLRGGSMSDVIFNGSSSRNPAGKAMVELTFDNSDALFGGEYGQYNEISIKREVGHDGSSDYFINNGNCRRKDITDIFMGTGLGQNSYALIEQGTISQFIEAKPEEIRTFIEEAAGVSRYKERKKETENRIKQTRENLLRLNDLLSEIDRQLKHLRAQASTAERYKKLKQEERAAKARLQTLHILAIDRVLAEQNGTLITQEQQLEQSTINLQSFTAKISALRAEHAQAIESFNTFQSHYYKVGANIAKNEQQIKYRQERDQELSRSIAQIQKNQQSILNNQTADQEKVQALQIQLEQLQNELQHAQQHALESQQSWEQSERNKKTLEDQWNEFNLSVAGLSKNLEVEKTNVIHLEQRLSSESSETEKLKQELANINLQSIEAELQTFITKLEDLTKNRNELQHQTANQQKAICDQKGKIVILENRLNQCRSKLQIAIGRHASVEALQQAALGKHDTTLITWLNQYQLLKQTRLAQEIRVSNGWEVAVEVVLGSYLEALCLTDLHSIIGAVQTLDAGNITVIDQTRGSTESPRSDLVPLNSKVESKIPLASLLNQVYTAKNLEQAITIQAHLQQHESVITQDGVWLGPNWLKKINGKNNPKFGIIRRAKELEELSNFITTEQVACQLQEQEILAHKNQLTQFEQNYQVLQKELNTSTAQVSALQTKIDAQKNHALHLNGRVLVLRESIHQHDHHLAELRQQLAMATTNCQQLLQAQQATVAQKEQLILARDVAYQAATTQQQQAKEADRLVENYKANIQLKQAGLDYTQQNLARYQRELLEFASQIEKLTQALAENLAPIATLEVNLKNDLHTRSQLEGELTLSKQKVAAHEHEIRLLEKKQHEEQTANHCLRDELEKLRTLQQGLQVRKTTYLEQLQENENDFAAISITLAPQMSISEGEQELALLTQRIEKIGPVNLAAIAETTQLEERRHYLAEQNQDLVKALQTLEEAIRKIDCDTRAKFKHAYEKINQKFQEIFPKVFQGGRAYLTHTEHDLLETGVMIMAEPPGKRNTSIQLLSGGEKALTAISLIFAIFHLNPAPFCILDEVDAPLDELNVNRFCNLVSEISKEVQFIFITHNKSTMEIANQLIGVTMQEPGVSRIVAVDVESVLADLTTPNTI